MRSLADRDEYGPLGGHAGGLFTVPVAPVVLLYERDELGHRGRATQPAARSRPRSEASPR